MKNIAISLSRFYNETTLVSKNTHKTSLNYISKVSLMGWDTHWLKWQVTEELKYLIIRMALIHNGGDKYSDCGLASAYW